MGERQPEGLRAGFPVVLVRDAVAALRRFASTLKRRMGFRLAAITGSAGKTTTKEFTAAILARRFTVEKTPGNQNSQIGFPMSIVNLPSSPEWLVGEMGLSEPGDLSKLSRAFEPDVAAILLVAPAHLEFFPSLEALAGAKAEILEGLKPGGTLVANADDPRVAAIAAGFAGPTLRFGRTAPAEITAREVESRPGGSRFVLVTPNGGGAGGFAGRRPPPGRQLPGRGRHRRRDRRGAGRLRGGRQGPQTGRAPGRAQAAQLGRGPL